MFSWLSSLLRRAWQPAYVDLPDEMWGEVLARVDRLSDAAHMRQVCKLFCSYVERTHKGLRLPAHLMDPIWLGVTYGRDDASYIHAKRCLRLLWWAGLMGALCHWEYTYWGFRFKVDDETPVALALRPYNVQWRAHRDYYVIFADDKQEKEFEMWAH